MKKRFGFRAKKAPRIPENHVQILTSKGTRLIHMFKTAVSLSGWRGYCPHKPNGGHGRGAAAKLKRAAKKRNNIRKFK